MKNKNNKKKTVPQKKTTPKKKAIPASKSKPEKKERGGLFNSRKGESTVPVAIPEPERKSQGGIDDYSEVIAESVERVRGEFLSDWRKPKITIAIKTITFNMACVNLFSDSQYITINMDRVKRRLFVEPTTEYDDTSLKFANYKNGKNVPRTTTITRFGPLLFKLMEWNPIAKYRILMIFREFGDKKVMIFNLADAQEVFSEVMESEDGKMKRNTTLYMPGEWQGRFGYRIDELAEKRRLDFSNELITFNHKTGDIESKHPTAEELIHEPYGGIRSRKEPKK